jgi:uncharacterized DUF497 family protein
MNSSLTEIFEDIQNFEWDKGNLTKNWVRHKVRYSECEEVFFNEPYIFEQDKVHSVKENRFYILGRTDGNRLLFIVFTRRGKKIRIISARDMSKKERKIYNEAVKKNTQI